MTADRTSVRCLCGHSWTVHLLGAYECTVCACQRFDAAPAHGEGAR